MDAFVVVEGNAVAKKLVPINLADEKPLTTDTDILQSAITWMYNAGLTKYDTKQTFLPNNTMTREEASKFFSVFAKNEFQKKENTDTLCDFSDLSGADSTLTSSIL